MSEEKEIEVRFLLPYEVRIVVDKSTVDKGSGFAYSNILYIDLWLSDDETEISYCVHQLTNAGLRYIDSGTLNSKELVSDDELWEEHKREFKEAVASRDPEKVLEFLSAYDYDKFLFDC